jgi:hypothetical protein
MPIVRFCNLVPVKPQSGVSFGPNLSLSCTLQWTRVQLLVSAGTTPSEMHPPSYPSVTKGSFPDHAFPSCAQLKSAWSYVLSSPYFFMGLC